MRKSRYNRKYQPVIFLIILILIVLIFIKNDDDQHISESISQFVAVEVIDGDTFRSANGEIIRLLGIDTPEIDQPYYIEATDFLRDLIMNDTLRFEYDHRKRDRHGRLLAYVFNDGKFVNREIIKAGMGRVYIFPRDMKNYRYRNYLIEDQKIARDSERGIWKNESKDTENYYVGNSKSFRFHRPDCRSVKSLDSSSRIIKTTRYEFLDMGYSPCRNCNP